MRVIIRGHGPVVGMDYTDALGNYADIRQAENDAVDHAIGHLESYGYSYDPEGDWEDEDAIQELDFYLEEYDPRKHDCQRSGGGSFADDFD